MDFKNFYAIAYSLNNIRSIKLESLCKQTGLNITCLNILEYLSICEELNTARDLTKMCGVKNAAFSIIINKLEKEGFVVQKSDVVDRRRKHILLTSKAESITEQLNGITKEVEAYLSRSFTEEEKTVLQKSILKLTDTMLQLNETLLNSKRAEKHTSLESIHSREEKNKEEKKYGEGCDNNVDCPDAMHSTGANF